MLHVEQSVYVDQCIYSLLYSHVTIAVSFVLLLCVF